jgi:hypothetical protein
MNKLGYRISLFLGAIGNTILILGYLAAASEGNEEDRILD